MCYGPAAQTGKTAANAAHSDARDMAMSAARATYQSARSLWMSQKPADDSNGAAWQTWQAAEPLHGAYMKPTMIATRPVQSAQGGGRAR